MKVKISFDWRYAVALLQALAVLAVLHAATHQERWAQVWADGGLLGFVVIGVGAVVMLALFCAALLLAKFISLNLLKRWLPAGLYRLGLATGKVLQHFRADRSRRPRQLP